MLLLNMFKSFDLSLRNNDIRFNSFDSKGDDATAYLNSFCLVDRELDS